MEEQYCAAVPGNFSVDQNGSACYKIDIQVPPGTGGLQPALSLLYHSTVTDGMLGIGWGLQGLSAVTRVAKTPAQDDVVVKSPIRFDGRDRFALDGQRLMVVAGEYGLPNAEYRTELETFRKVTTVHDEAGSGPLGFTVQGKDGLRYEYGSTADSRIHVDSESSAIRVWALSGMTDRYGNFLTVSYRRDPRTASYYPTSIEYTGNSGVQPQRKVTFEYEGRPSEHPRYEAGCRIDSTLRLKSIRTFVEDRSVLSYTLEYSLNHASGRSQLMSIVFADAKGNTVLPTRFDWMDLPELLYASPEPLADAELKAGATVIPLDISGSGRRDIIGLSKMSSGGISIEILQSLPGEISYVSSTQEFPSLPWTEFGLMPMDVDCDGRTELLHVAKKEGKLALTLLFPREESGRWTFVEGPLFDAGPLDLPYGGDLIPMDVNGDGRVDLVYCYADSNHKLRIQTLLSNGTRFEAGDATDTDLPYSSTGQFIPVDFDGDGMSDLLYAYADQRQGQQRLGLRVLISHGPGFSPAMNAFSGLVDLPFGGSLIAVHLKDDAVDDLIYSHADANSKLNLYTLFGTGVGYQLISPVPMKTTLPFNGWLFPSAGRGAGMIELMVATQTKEHELATSVLRWNGSSFDEPSACVAPDAKRLRWGGQILAADVSGRGKTDMLYGVQTADRKTTFQLYAAPATVPGRLERIREGFGGVIEITYGPLTDPTVYTKGPDTQEPSLETQSLLNAGISGSTWPMAAGSGSALSKGTRGASYALASRQFPEYVVAEYSMSDNLGHRYGFRYQYSGCRIDMSGRGWLGFGYRRVIDQDAGTTLIEEYQQYFPTTGMVASSTLCRTSDDALLARSSSKATITGHQVAMSKPQLVTWQGERGAGVYRVEVTGLVRERFTPGNTTPDVTETQTDQYDSYGNQIAHRSESSQGAPVYYRNEYENDEAQWVIGRLKLAEVSADPSFDEPLNRCGYTYEAQFAKPSEQSQWDEVHKRWLSTLFEYDRFGNQTVKTDCSGARTEIVYDVVFHSFPERHLLPENASGKIAKVQSEYEPGFGKEIRRVDANGCVWEQSVDGLGRITETRGRAPDGSSVPLTRVRWSKDEAGFYKELLERTEWSKDSWCWRRSYQDSLGREHRVATLAPDSTRQIVIDRSHSFSGEALKTSLPYLSGDEPIYVEYQYDCLNRIVRQTEPTATGETRVIEFTYPQVGCVIQQEAGHTTRSEYSVYLGSPVLVRLTDAEGGVSSYHYDVLGRMVAAQDPAGIETRSRYDSLGRRCELNVVSGDTIFASEKVVRDDIHRTEHITTHQGNTIEILRDGRGRVLRRTTNSSETTAWHYDQADGRLAEDRLAGVSMPEGTSYQYSYDAMGNVCEEALEFEGETWRTHRVFGPSKNLLSVTHPDGSVVGRKFNATGQLTDVAFSEPEEEAKPIAAFTDFTPLLHARTVTFHNGLTERFEFARTGQLREQTLKGSASVLAHTGFHWDNQHQLTKIEDLVSTEKTQTFEYDSLGRLTGVERNSKSSAFAYDSAGNLVLKDGITYSYRGQQVVSGEKDGSVLFDGTYDADGNLRDSTYNGEKSTFQYDSLGRMIASGTSRFQYDHTGRRLKKQSVDATTLYITDEFEVTIFAGVARQNTRYLSGPRGTVAQITRALSAESAGKVAGVPSVGIRYVHVNQVNSTAMHTGEDGQITGQITYHPFGEIDTISGQDDFRRKFTGKEFDAETGLYYFNARYYDPRLGRFISGDDRAGGDFERADSMNRYAYVLNSPITGIDLDGHFRFDILADVLLGIAAVTLIAAATVLTGGAAAALMGSILLGAAVSGTFSSIEQSGDNFSWGQWGVAVGVGAATGAISGGFTGAGIAAGARLGAYALARTGSALVDGLVRVAFNAGVGALSGSVTGLVGNGLLNAAHGENFFDNWQSNVGKSAWRGAITGSLTASYSIAKPSVRDLLVGGGITGGKIIGTGVGLMVVSAISSGIGLLVDPPTPDRGLTSPGQAVRPSSQPSLRFTPVF